MTSRATMDIKKCPFCGGIGELTMYEKIEEKVGKELYNDLSSIMSEEYEKRMLITPSYCANKLLEKGYRKESDTAREILKWLVWNKHLFNRTHEIGFEKPRTSYLIMSDEIEELAEKYGVDLGE